MNADLLITLHSVVDTETKDCLSLPCTICYNSNNGNNENNKDNEHRLEQSWQSANIYFPMYVIPSLTVIQSTFLFYYLSFV